MFKKKLFGDYIEPDCAYCEHGNYTRDGKSVLCIKRGIVSPGYCCPKYLYAPLKRVPKGMNTQLPTFSAEDFEL